MQTQSEKIAQSVAPPAIPDEAAKVAALDEAGLIKLLSTADAPVFEKAKACQRLAVVGTKQAVPALAALLGDAQLAAYARFGLQPIEDPAVDEALRAALPKLKGALLVGVINSVAQRRDARAVKPLAKLLDDADAEVAGAAAAALGRIADAGSAAILRKALDANARIRPALAAAALECADRLQAAGKRAQASPLLDRLKRADIPKPVQTAANAARP